MISEIKFKLSQLLKKETNINKKEDNLVNNSILDLFVEAAAIDGNISDEEKKKILFFLTKKFDFSLSDAETKLQESINNSKDQVEIWSKTKAIRNDMNYDQRLEFIEMIWQIILVDEFIDDFEAQLMRRLCGLLYIDDKDSGIIKNKVRERLSSK
tara:strand:+ start:34 stop:498 length:465 start_codon:yes stop_codon:yes gene_type:complete